MLVLFSIISQLFKYISIIIGLVVMGILHVEIDDELEREFRKKIAEHLGMKRGNLKLAVEQAIRLWVKEH